MGPFWGRFGGEAPLRMRMQTGQRKCVVILYCCGTIIMNCDDALTAPRGVCRRLGRVAICKAYGRQTQYNK